MSMMPLLSGWTVPTASKTVHIRKYSTTGDILSYKRCRRQYGFFGVRGFSSATATQRYFGTLVHDVLDRINRDYRLQPARGLPDEAQIDDLVAEAHERLIQSGVRPYNARQQRKQAAKLIFRFVSSVGPHFFRHVRQTEYRLERALQTHTGRDYVLDGIVDVLSGSVSHALQLNVSTDPDDVEIWDYKSGRMPRKDSQELTDYTYQMRVYAELYRQQAGAYPARCVLVFVGELGDDRWWELSSGVARKFPDLFYIVQPNPSHIKKAIGDFHHTVELIEAEREAPFSQQWAPPSHEVDTATCEACEIRYSCGSFKDAVRQRREPL
jgi:DNA helicase-2/ATP-dependent DNA helicase PcrA